MLLINNYFLIKFHRRLNHYDSLKINRHENLKIYVGHKKVKRKSRSLLILFDKQTIYLALATFVMMQSRLSPFIFIPSYPVSSLNNEKILEESYYISSVSYTYVFSLKCIDFKNLKSLMTLTRNKSWVRKQVAWF